MTIANATSYRTWGLGSAHGGLCLQDKFEVLKEIGDGSFGSVALARVRGAGAHVARRGTLVAIKTMKKTFESFGPCLELREIVFLRTLPHHPHLVPALDIFLDPLSKKLHIAMEYMDGNLYQLMKARDHKPFDSSTVKSILYQILFGLEHIHESGFFHRDIKPENILVSVSAREDFGSARKRSSQLVTPPPTPQSYSIKIADFGLARETHSKLPYTTYVSTRWYRAPEVLLRAGEYSAPVDIWAIGAMAVEVATLKPLFPGGNEVDQVWRVCEIMGSPGNWVDKQGAKVGGGEWREGVKLAQKLGFSFPKMAPHTMDSILQSPQWPPALCNFVTWCLMWDPKSRPTSTQSLAHEYFADAYDPLRPISSRSGLLARKQSDLSTSTLSSPVEPEQKPTSRTPSWFRKSLITRESAPTIPQHIPVPQCMSVSPVRAGVIETTASNHSIKPNMAKRNTWASGALPTGAPMPILPSLRPVSPLSNTVTAQAYTAHADGGGPKKLGRQLSVASRGNHYSDMHRQEAERALSGQVGPTSPSSGPKESFFSHLRKRARRLSGRQGLPMSPQEDDMEANVGCVPWGGSHRNSWISDLHSEASPTVQSNFAELDKALHHVTAKTPQRVASNPMLRRHHSLPHSREQACIEGSAGQNSLGLTVNRTRRAAQKPGLPSDQYETPDEQEELLDEALSNAHAATVRLEHNQQEAVATHHISPGCRDDARPPIRQAATERTILASYPTPSPSAKRNSVVFGPVDLNSSSRPIEIDLTKHHPDNVGYPVPTPPYDENEWAAAAAASIFAASEHWR